MSPAQRCDHSRGERKKSYLAGRTSETRPSSRVRSRQWQQRPPNWTRPGTFSYGEPTSPPMQNAASRRDPHARKVLFSLPLPSVITVCSTTRSKKAPSNQTEQSELRTCQAASASMLGKTYYLRQQLTIRLRNACARTGDTFSFPFSRTQCARNARESSQCTIERRNMDLETTPCSVLLKVATSYSNKDVLEA